MRDALGDIVASAQSRVPLKEGDVIVDIGCNDGTLLNGYDKGAIRIGFDPVENIRGENESFTRVSDYFTADGYHRMSPRRKAKIITSIAMFYDLEDPNRFVADIARILDPAIAEVEFIQNDR